MVETGVLVGPRENVEGAVVVLVDEGCCVARGPRRLSRELGLLGTGPAGFLVSVAGVPNADVGAACVADEDLKPKADFGAVLEDAAGVPNIELAGADVAVEVVVAGFPKKLGMDEVACCAGC